MKRLTIACLVATVPLAAAGCSGSRAPSGAASYLDASKSKVTFIQWRTAANGHLQGRITSDGVGGSAPAQTVSSTSAHFTGTMRGKSVTLTFAPLYFLHDRANGTISGSVLTIRVPQSDGTIRQVRFSESDKGRHDRAIAALHGTIRKANLLAVREQAGQRRGTADAQTERNSQVALNALDRSSSLAAGGALADGMARIAHDVRATRAHLAAERKDASRSDKYCSGALTVGGDAKAVDGALQSVQGDTLLLMSDIATVRRDMVTTTGLLHHLHKAGIRVPKSASDVIAGANVKMSQAIARANFYIDQANATDARARTFANNMSVGRCSGARNGSFVRPIPHIR
jgi:hypothetical protein